MHKSFYANSTKIFLVHDLFKRKLNQLTSFHFQPTSSFHFSFLFTLYIIWFKHIFLKKYRLTSESPPIINGLKRKTKWNFLKYLALYIFQLVSIPHQGGSKVFEYVWENQHKLNPSIIVFCCYLTNLSWIPTLCKHDTKF